MSKERGAETEREGGTEGTSSVTLCSELSYLSRRDVCSTFEVLICG